MAGEQRQRRLLVADFALSFMWTWSGVVNWIFVYRVLGFSAHPAEGEIVRYAFAVVNMFFFAAMTKATGGGMYNPLTVLATAVSGDFSNFLFTVGARIPAQVVGSIYAVRLMLSTLPDIARGPRLNVNITKGALTEGFLTFAVVIISLTLSRKGNRGFLMNTWISSASKLTLHILGSDLTGGCMNPAPAMGWAFARGEHITKDHLLVYWLAPILGTLAAVWFFGRIIQGKTSGPSSDVKNDNSPKLKSEKSD